MRRSVLMLLFALSGLMQAGAQDAVAFTSSAPEETPPVEVQQAPRSSKGWTPLDLSLFSTTRFKEKSVYGVDLAAFTANHPSVVGFQVGGLGAMTDFLVGFQVGGIGATASDGLYGLSAAGGMYEGRDVVGLVVCGGASMVGGTMTGLQVSGIYNMRTQYLLGGQVAGLENETVKRQWGFQIAGIGNVSWGDAAGLQIAGFGNIVNGSMSGVQIAAFGNAVEKTFNGLQIALVNQAEEGHYVQLGLINYSSTVKTGLTFCPILRARV